jgi:hypothetical protein
MEEADAFEFTQDERVRCLTIWITKEGMSSCYRGVHQGQVAAIRIDTNHDRTMTCHPFRAEDTLKECLVHQYQVDPHEDIVSFSHLKLRCITLLIRCLNRCLLEFEFS